MLDWTGIDIKDRITVYLGFFSVESGFELKLNRGRINNHHEMIHHA